MIILHPSALMISRNVCHEITMQYIMFKLFTSEAKQHPGFFPMYSRRFKRNHFLFNKFPLIFHNFTFCDKSNRSICGNFFTSNRLYTCQQNCTRSLSWISTSGFYNLNQIMLFNPDPLVSFAVVISTKSEIAAKLSRYFYEFRCCIDESIFFKYHDRILFKPL